MNHGNSKTGKARTGWENLKWRLEIVFGGWMVMTIFLITLFLGWRTYVDQQYPGLGDAAEIHACLFWQT